MNFTQSALDRWKSRRNVMFDIESIGTNCGAVVTSIGALQFCPWTGETFEKFKVNIDIQSAIKKGLTVNGNTLNWWFNQSKEAQQGMLTNPVPIDQALSDFNKWARALTDGVSPEPIPQKSLYWWANGANFDFVLTDGAYDACGKEWKPWHYRNLMDYRTLRTLTGYRAPDSYFDSVVKHDALADCEIQVKMVKDVFEWLVKM